MNEPQKSVPQKLDAPDRIWNLKGLLGYKYKYSGANLIAEFGYFENQSESNFGTITSSVSGICTIPNTGDDDDHWIDGYIEIKSGTNAGKRYLITDSTATLITADAFPSGEATETYELRLPFRKKLYYYDASSKLIDERPWEDF